MKAIQQLLTYAIATSMTCFLLTGTTAIAQIKTPMKKKILFVVTSTSQKGNTGEPTGFYLSEVSHPWEVLVNAGYEIDFVSPKGGKAPVTGFDLSDATNDKFWKDPIYHHKIENTLRPSEINTEHYAAIHYAGGLGVMWDFAENKTLASIAADIYENGGIISAVCHGPAGLLNVKLSNGKYLIEGKKINAYSNEEETVIKMEKVVPYLLETALINRGALYEKSGVAQVHVVKDQRIITGQNPESARAVGEALLAEITNSQIAARISRYEIKSSYQDSFRTLLHNYVFHSLPDKGNIMTEIYYDEESPAVHWVIERWTTSHELERFSHHPSAKAVMDQAKVIFVKPAVHINVKDLEPLSREEWRKAKNATDHPLTIMLFVDAKSGTAATFMDLYHTAMPLFRSEPGVINYQLSQLESDRTQFVTYEKFRNEAAFQYHLQFPPIQPVLDFLNSSIEKQPFQTGLHRLIPIAL